jgi:hypothetical protein
MSGVFPNGGVPFNETQNAVNVPTVGCGSETFYDSNACSPRFSAPAMNALISEFLQSVTGLGATYTCTDTEFKNLSNALRTYHPCYAQAANSAELAGMEGDEKVVTCIDGKPRAVSFSAFPFDLDPLPLSTCNPIGVVFAKDSNGRGRFYTYTASTLRIGRWDISTTHPAPFTQNFPTLPTIPEHNVSHYTQQQLLADAIVDPRVVGGTSINTVRLKNTLVVNSENFTITCPGNYDITYLSPGGVIFDPVAAGISQLVYTIDDGTGEKVVVSASLGSIGRLGNFTSFESNLDLTATISLAAGTYKIYIYVVAGSPTANAAQMRVSAVVSGGGVLSTSGNVTVSKSVA